MQSPEETTMFKVVFGVVSLCNNVTASSIKDRQEICVRVPLDRRSLVVVSGPARYLWQHEIRRSDIPTRRIAMTFRELSDIFTPGFDNLTSEQTIGKELLQIASTYNGRVCNKQNV
ncbi:unnamed protein product [Trichobilharzia regenti]|nr:unnamed protein product [Trichobilharzia regenti]